MIKVQIKKLDPKAKIPEYKTEGASGVDIMALLENKITLDPGESKIIPTGLWIAFPDDLEVQIRPRSGLAAKSNVSVLNTPGTIDTDYRGEIKVILINQGQETFKVEKGLRIAQMVVCPVVQAQIKEVEDLSETERCIGGFGSTGSK